ncbi:hypothetical protein BD311DRAFT_768215 [Dichomitus squalens]|uniref:Uncharacterized protein n=1 Tax=Dichomitus squalens TaxID=114155 RepID=A0A4V2JZ77_9APHY|nr:hypothetical protein BD311DRAFT_768215 [Dichomitus squalens]
MPPAPHASSATLYHGRSLHGFSRGRGLTFMAVTPACSFVPSSLTTPHLPKGIRCTHRGWSRRDSLVRFYVIRGFRLVPDALKPRRQGHRRCNLPFISVLSRSASPTFRL